MLRVRSASRPDSPSIMNSCMHTEAMSHVCKKRRSFSESGPESCMHTKTLSHVCVISGPDSCMHTKNVCNELGPENQSQILACTLR